MNKKAPAGEPILFPPFWVWVFVCLLGLGILYKYVGAGREKPLSGVKHEDEGLPTREATDAQAEIDKILQDVRTGRVEFTDVTKGVRTHYARAFGQIVQDMGYVEKRFGKMMKGISGARIVSFERLGTKEGIRVSREELATARRAAELYLESLEFVMKRAYAFIQESGAPTPLLLDLTRQEKREMTERLLALCDIADKMIAEVERSKPAYDPVG